MARKKETKKLIGMVMNGANRTIFLTFNDNSEILIDDERYFAIAEFDLQGKDLDFIAKNLPEKKAPEPEIQPEPEAE